MGSGYRLMLARSSTALPLELDQIDQTQMDIVVVDEETRQSVAGRALPTACVGSESGSASTRTPKPSSPSTSTIEMWTRNAAGDAHKVNTAVSALSPV